GAACTGDALLLGAGEGVGGTTDRLPDTAPAEAAVEGGAGVPVVACRAARRHLPAPALRVADGGGARVTVLAASGHRLVDAAPQRIAALLGAGDAVIGTRRGGAAET